MNAPDEKTDERGAITPYTLIFIVILMLFIGLAVDGGNKLRAGWEAIGTAEEAARAGAGQIDREAAYRGTGRFVVDRATALRAARAYLSTSGHAGTVAAAGPQTIRVTVKVTKPTWMLSMVGISSVSESATSTADLVSGVEGPGR